jgi:hypothetical protein
MRFYSDLISFPGGIWSFGFSYCFPSLRMEIRHIDGAGLLLLSAPLFVKFFPSLDLPLRRGKDIKPLSFLDRKQCRGIEFFGRSYQAKFASRRSPEKAKGGVSVLPASQDFLQVSIP